MALIAGCLTRDNVDAMLADAENAECDILEARLDFLKDTAGLSGLRSLDKPVIITCMPEWEGGRFKGGEEERIRILIEALDFADFITVELNTGEELRDSLVDAARQAGVKSIVSYHDFNSTPPDEEIARLSKKIFECGADIAKIACMPQTEEDVARMMLMLSRQEKEKAIFLSMGEKGKLSRVMSHALGGFLTYGYLGGVAAGPGQLSVSDLKSIYGLIWG